MFGKSVILCRIYSEKVSMFCYFIRKKCIFFASHGKDTWLLHGGEVEIRKIKVAGG